MIKRSPSICNPNSPRAFWNPKNIPNIPLMVMRMAGFNSDNGILFPEIDEYNINLKFQLDPGQTKTESISSKNGTWVLLEKMATILGPQSELPLNIHDLLIVGSYVVSDVADTNITLIEEQPISLVFGTGEWQLGLFPETWSSINNRVFTVKNLSSYNVTVDLGFKLIRVQPEVIS